MKKLLYLACMVLGVSLSSVAQEKTKIAVSEGVESLKVSETSNEYNFVLPVKKTKAEVEKAASYYKNDLAVTFDEGKNSIHVKVIGTDKKSKYVMARLLTACGASYVKVGDKNMEMADFIKVYLN